MSSQPINPIDIFFSKGNVNALYGAIQTHLKTKYNKNIGREYLNEILEVMKMIVKPLPKRMEKDKVNIKKFVTTLNKQTLREALPLFEGSITTHDSPQLPESTEGPIAQTTFPSQLGMETNSLYTQPQSGQGSPGMFSYPQLASQQQDQYNQQSRMPNMQAMSLPGGIPQPSYGGSNDDNMRQSQELDTLYAQLAQDRGNGNGYQQRPTDIDFTKLGNVPQTNDPKFNTSINDLYQYQQDYRQSGAEVAIPPPNAQQLQNLQQAPFQITEKFQISKPPIYQNNNTTNIGSPGMNNIQGMPNHSMQFQPPQNNFCTNNQVPMNIPQGAMSTSIHDIRRQEDEAMKNQQQVSKIQYRTQPLSVDNIYEGQTQIQQHSHHSQQPDLNQSFEQAFAPEQFAQTVPRIDRNVTYPVQSHDFANVTNSMNNHDPIAPQPGQMSTLIPKTSRNTTTADRSNTIPVNISVDSRNKDPTQSHSSYRIALDEIRDVLSIELTDAQIPISEYAINETNNIIYFEETNGVILSGIIIPGNYTATDLATEIEAQMTAVGGSIYTVSVDTLQNKFIFSSNGVGGAGLFNLLFDGGTESIGYERERTVYIERSIGEVVGFAPEDQSGSLMYSGQFTYNLKGEKYILLYVKEAELIKTRDSNVKNAFAKIVLDQPLGQTKYYNRNVDNRFKKYFSPAIGRLAQLTIEFRKQNGELYEFNGQNNSLSFEVTTKDLTTPIYQDGISVTNV